MPEDDEDRYRRGGRVPFNDEERDYIDRRIQHARNNLQTGIDANREAQLRFLSADEIDKRIRNGSGQRFFNIGIEVSDDPNRPGKPEQLVRDRVALLMGETFPKVLKHVESQISDQSKGKERAKTLREWVVALAGVLGSGFVMWIISELMQVMHK